MANYGIDQSRLMLMNRVYLMKTPMKIIWRLLDSFYKFRVQSASSEFCLLLR